jgi:hypothetical protein
MEPLIISSLTQVEKYANPKGTMIAVTRNKDLPFNLSSIPRAIRKTKETTNTPPRIFTFRFSAALRLFNNSR